MHCIANGEIPLLWQKRLQSLSRPPVFFLEPCADSQRTFREKARTTEKVEFLQDDYFQAGFKTAARAAESPLKPPPAITISV